MQRLISMLPRRSSTANSLHLLYKRLETRATREKCNLTMGEECREAKDANINSCTMEMHDLETLCGEETAVPIVDAVCQGTGEDLVVNS